MENVEREHGAERTPGRVLGGRWGVEDEDEE